LCAGRRAASGRHQQPGNVGACHPSTAAAKTLASLKTHPGAWETESVAEILSVIAVELVRAAIWNLEQDRGGGEKNKGGSSSPVRGGKMKDPEQDT